MISALLKHYFAVTHILGKPKFEVVVHNNETKAEKEEIPENHKETKEKIKNSRRYHFIHICL